MLTGTQMSMKVLFTCRQICYQSVSVEVEFGLVTPWPQHCSLIMLCQSPVSRTCLV